MHHLFCVVCYCQRKDSGITSVMEKKYMVYFIQSPFTKKSQVSWICGGALVTATQILTAAACLVETENIYAIAGYNKYVSAKDIDNDDCTRLRKQRVIKIVFTTEEYEHPAQRTNVDIGIAVVEKPYNFSNYLSYCSYEPQPIYVNYENKYELVNTQAIALGWGTIDKQSESTQETTYQFQQETPTMILDKKRCTKILDTPEIVHIIDKYYLCGSNYFKGIENDTEYKFRSLNDSMMENYGLASKNDTDENNDDNFEENIGFRRKNNNNKNSNAKTAEQMEEYEYDGEKYTTKINVYGNRNNRKDFNQKNCQNNLGSPLIKQIDDREIMIGITSSALHGECNGSVLYVSTAASSKLIKCLLETNAVIRNLCNLKSDDRKFKIREIEINWPALEVLDTLTSQSNIGYINRANNQQDQSAQESHNQTYAHVHPVPYPGYAHQRASVQTLLARPQFELGSKDKKKTYTEEQLSGERELLPEEHYIKKQLHGQQFDTAEKQKYERPYITRENLSLRDQYRLSNNQHFYRQNGPYGFNQPPSQHQSASDKSPEGIKQQVELYPEVSDQSRENHKNPETEPSESYMAQIEALHHKLANDDKGDAKEGPSFDQILAHLQKPPNAPILRGNSHENTNKMLIDLIIKHNTKHEEPYEESQEDVLVKPPVVSEEVLIRPQVPMSNANY